MNRTIIVPTLNAAAEWPLWAPALRSAIAADQTSMDVLILDSSSTDGTPDLARDAGFRLHSIPRGDFNHGGTRQLGVRLSPGSDLLIFLTQDAVLAHSDAIATLVRAFDDPAVAIAYGRQLPRPHANPIEAHARLFNYPANSHRRTLASRGNAGLKTIFLSNSFAAYRRSALEAVGGFPSGLILGEDTITAAHVLIAGWKIAYVAEACVYHSHAYSPLQELKRYFDTGVLHSRQRWVLDTFGLAGSEGKRFLLSELKYLAREKVSLIPAALLRTGMKWIGYKLGTMEDRIPSSVKRKISMHHGFWAENHSNHEPASAALNDPSAVGLTGKVL